MNHLLDKLLIKKLIYTVIKEPFYSLSPTLFNLNTNFYNLLFLVNEFSTNWNTKNKLFLSNSDNITISQLKVTSSLAFAFIHVETLCTFSDVSTKSISNNNICFILSKENKTWIIDYIISEEHTPLLYKKLITNAFINSDLENYTQSTINYYTNLLNNFNGISFPFSSNFLSRAFNFSKSIEYAEKYALNYNPNFKSFDKIGGDCTNFVSQSINFAGVPSTSTWKPYSHPWIRVIELRNYLIYNKIASESSIITSTSPGSIIQFFHKERKTWTHSGIITYLRGNKDCLYCCHSYDKLNYPLSLVYPSIYPKLRIITPY